MKKLKKEKKFVIPVKQVDEAQKLVLVTLIETITQSSEALVANFNEMYAVVYKSFKLRLLDDIFLGDELLLRAKVTKLNSEQLDVKVNIYKLKDGKEYCTTIGLFSYELQSKTTRIAS